MKIANDSNYEPCGCVSELAVVFCSYATLKDGERES